MGVSQRATCRYDHLLIDVTSTLIGATTHVMLDITNDTPATVVEWALALCMPRRLLNVYNARFASLNGREYLVSPEPWNMIIPMFETVSFGFLVDIELFPVVTGARASVAPPQIDHLPSPKVSTEPKLYAA